MRKLIELIIGIIAFSSCGSPQNKKEGLIYNNVQETKNADKDISHSDSVRHSNKMPQYDNMRGFDPPSEDDMDDNGMSRYVENNDEEGWY